MSVVRRAVDFRLINLPLAVCTRSLLNYTMQLDDTPIDRLC